ncbi:hypothetical protein PC111_g13393 [Phytophthora cactorum]|nr:hypothetical protein PC111_g13393 [Phytophthora cactorum]
MLRPRTRERCKKYLRPLTRQTTSHPRMARMARIMKECHRRRQPWTTGETKRRTAKILVQALTTVLKRGRLLWMTARLVLHQKHTERYQTLETRIIPTKPHSELPQFRCQFGLTDSRRLTQRGNSLRSRFSSFNGTHLSFSRSEPVSPTQLGIRRSSSRRKPTVSQANAGPNAKGILQYLRERTGKTTILLDAHNLVQSIKKVGSPMLSAHVPCWRSSATRTVETLRS